ncbi:hypothetical protein HMPREF1980_00408 [Actinomyces sp. oral taxon 172 str. F0311]|nr:hypothetical protein HMPREF1980_00408 [Actinomyces sp. oral taxon 172 str. F0311]
MATASSHVGGFSCRWREIFPHHLAIVRSVILICQSIATHRPARCGQ